MPTAENAKIQIEMGRELLDYEIMTDSGDHQYFTASEDVFSGRGGYEPQVRPNGLINGGRVTPAASGANDQVDVAALSCYLAGVETSVSAESNVAITRGESTNVCRITSITVTSTGQIDAVEGSAGTSFSETRGADGGPPYIPAGSIEIAQVRTSSTSSAPISSDEIFSVPGQHTEFATYPTWEIDNIGRGLAARNPAEMHAHVKFSSPLPTIHTGDVTKRVYIRFYVPIMADLSKTLDFKPAENTHSVSSTSYYGGVVASVSSTLGQGSFTALLTNGVNDTLVREKNQVLTVKYFPDRLKSPYILTQGKVGISRSFPVAGQIQATCTISAEMGSSEFEG